MNDQRLDELTPIEFQTFTDNLLSDEFDKVTVTELFGALDAMDKVSPEVIELTAHIEDGQLAAELEEWQALGAESLAMFPFEDQQP